MNDLYENAKNGLKWHLSVSSNYHLPEKLCNTYDLMSPDSYKLFGYNGMCSTIRNIIVGVMHLLYLKVFRELAVIMKDTEWVNKCVEEIDKASESFKQHHWNGEYFKSYSDGCILLYWYWMAF